MKTGKIQFKQKKIKLAFGTFKVVFLTFSYKFSFFCSVQEISIEEFLMQDF